MDNYIVSARKYRPSTFKSVVGQKALTTTLKNAIQNNKLAHAYLFCGPRGVGKTSCARIFAKTINCLHPTADHEACNACESCQAFNEQRSYNIHELDAASNNSVDDIRQLIDQVRIPPAIGKYKVFIIDEVHMLSSAAFNAFLKTLEEPPHHALFVLATTEKHKVLPTILSRCQIYDFSRISLSDIVEHLQYVASSEQVTAEPEALNVIAQKADGGMRDALSILDQVISFTNGKITYQTVIDNLNVLDYEYYFKLTEAILKGNVRQALLLLNEILNKGFDGQNIITGLTAHFRDLLVCKDEATLILFEVGASIRERYKHMAQHCPDTFLFKAIELCNQCDLNFRTSKNKRLLLELTLIQLSQLLIQNQPEDKKKNLIEPLNTGSDTVAVSATQPVSSAHTARQISVGTAANLQNSSNGAALQSNERNFRQTLGNDSHTTLSSGETSTAAAVSEQKRPMRPPVSGTSLRDLGESKSQVKEPPVKQIQAQELITRFTQQDLENAWNTFANRIEKKVYLKNIMLNCKPEITDDSNFNVKVHNPGQQEELNNYSVDILKVLRVDLKNTRLQFQIIIDESNQKQLAYTASEKYDHLLKINSSLGRLREEFSLTPD